MINHYVSEKRILELNEMHHLITCVSCRFCIGVSKNDLFCLKRNIGIYNTRQKCEAYKEYNMGTKKLTKEDKI